MQFHKFVVQKKAAAPSKQALDAIAVYKVHINYLRRLYIYIWRDRRIDSSITSAEAVVFSFQKSNPNPKPGRGRDLSADELNERFSNVSIKIKISYTYILYIHT